MLDNLDTFFAEEEAKLEGILLKIGKATSSEEAEKIEEECRVEQAKVRALLSLQTTKLHFQNYETLRDMK